MPNAIKRLREVIALKREFQSVRAQIFTMPGWNEVVTRTRTRNAQNELRIAIDNAREKRWAYMKSREDYRVDFPLSARLFGALIPWLPQ